MTDRRLRTLNWGFLDEAELRALLKLARRRPDVLNDADALLALDEDGLLALRGIGRVSIGALGRLRERALAWADEPAPDWPARRLLVRTDEAAPDWPLLDPVLAADLTTFVESRPERDRHVVRARWGIRHERQTLITIGRDLGVERERVRQVEAASVDGLRRSLSVAPQRIADAVRSVSPETLPSLLPTLRAQFADDECLFRCLERMADLSRGALPVLARGLRAPRRPGSVVDSWLATEGGPFTESVVLDALARLDPYSGTPPEDLLRRLLAEDRLRRRGGLIVAGVLPRQVAVAHVLAGVPEGRHWLDVARAIDAGGHQPGPFPKIRSNAAVHQARPWVYPVGSGWYRHVRFWPIDPERIPILLAAVRAVLESSSGVANVHQLHRNLGRQIDYWDLRHLLSGHGHAAGLVFEGRCRRDSVSLDGTASPKVFSDAVHDLLVSLGRPATIAEITATFPSASRAFVVFALRRLGEAGRVQRPSRGRYVAVPPDERAPDDAGAQHPVSD